MPRRVSNEGRLVFKTRAAWFSVVSLAPQGAGAVLFAVSLGVDQIHGARREGPRPYQSELSNDLCWRTCTYLILRESSFTK
jgi:hypothetical protein